MPNPNCFGGIEVAACRISALAANGSPLTGANHGYVTAAINTVDIKPDLLKGIEEIQQSANTNICQYFRDCDRLKDFEITVNMCTMEPDFVNLTTGGVSIASTGAGIYSAAQSGKTVGGFYPNPTDSCPNGVCIEFWELAWDQTVQATSNLFAAAGSLTYWHHVFPKVKFQIDDQKLDNKFRTPQLKGVATTNPRVTANGPFDDWPISVANAGGFTGLGGYFLDNSFPTAACGLISVPSAAS